MVSRRKMLVVGAGALAGGVAMAAGLEAVRSEAQGAEQREQESAPAPEVVAPGPSDARAGEGAAGRVPIVVPNGSTLPWRLVDGVKVYHLIAEPVTREFAPGLEVDCWGYNGSTPGPVIEAVEGDRVRIYVSNRLPEPTSVHWHGILLPNGMDGVAGLTQKPIPSGATFKYEFTLRQSGSFMYHPHFDEMLQMGMGMMGMFVIHPREPQEPRIDRDFAIMLAEWAIAPGARRANTTVMNDFNLLTLNSKVYPATEPLVVRRGDRVRIRLGNLGPTDHHPLHLHGHKFRVVGTDGGAIPESAQWPETSILVPVGSTRDIELVADQPGDWAFHCHMTHHTMNQMGHGLPNMLGVKSRDLDAKVQGLLPDYMSMGEGGMGGGEMAMRVPPNTITMLGGKGPFGPIDMGGMFTVLKVRDHLESYADPGSYPHPPETVASPASAAELRADGIRIKR